MSDFDATGVDPSVDHGTDQLDAPAPFEENEPVDAVTMFRVMTVEAVTFDLVDAAPVVHLMEAEAPFRYVAIPLGLPDAVAMHQALSGVEGRRPGTHELMATVLARAQIDVIAARIVRYEHGVFYAELDLMTPRGHERFDCRTSDAITLALRQTVPSPVLCAEEVLGAVTD